MKAPHNLLAPSNALTCVKKTVFQMQVSLMMLMLGTDTSSWSRPLIPKGCGSTGQRCYLHPYGCSTPHWKKLLLLTNEHPLCWHFQKEEPRMQKVPVPDRADARRRWCSTTTNSKYFHSVAFALYGKGNTPQRSSADVCKLHKGTATSAKSPPTSPSVKTEPRSNKQMKKLMKEPWHVHILWESSSRCK